MQLLKTQNASACIDVLRDKLTTELQQGKQVLWFMTGGSNIAVDIALMQQLDAELTKNLVVTLTDERYGDYGHADSNWQQLHEGGIDYKQARAIPVLQPDNQSLEQTTGIYATNLDEALAQADTIIGFYGLGTDGHIAGILPHTAAVDARGISVTSYSTDQYTRITTTFDTIRRCDVAYMFASGESKLQALQDLQTDRSLDDQPSQILKQLSAACVYNDQIGDPV